MNAALRLQDVLANGTKQTVHVLVCTYNETAELVRECVLRLLIAPEPIYMEKIIYVCDDGHAKSEGPKKRAMVEQLQALGASPVMHACALDSAVHVMRRRTADHRIPNIVLWIQASSFTMTRAVDGCPHCPDPVVVPPFQD